VSRVASDAEPQFGRAGCVLAFNHILTVQGLLPASAADLAPARVSCLVQVPVSETLYPARMLHPIRSCPRAVMGRSLILLPCPVELLHALDRIPAPAPNRAWYRRIDPSDQRAGRWTSGKRGENVNRTEKTQFHQRAELVRRVHSRILNVIRERSRVILKPDTNQSMNFEVS
jgi:hypothetical protein